MSTQLLIAAMAVAGASGVPGLVLSRRGVAGQRTAAALQLAAALLGGAAAVLTLLRGPGPELRGILSPALPELALGLDALSAVFVLPVCLLCACAAVYDLGYCRASEHARGGRPLRLGCGLLFASLLGVLAARDGVAFLIAWEIMALSAFFLVATEHWRPEVRFASWIYLGATHAGTLLLIAFFCVLQAATGSFGFAAGSSAAIAPASRDLLFVLALLGFGAKAGLVPLHFWLPPAHAAAPSHVSAIMSGVLIKMGIYGLLRACWLMPQPPLWWGLLVLALGAVSALGGVAFAIGQHDLKRLLAWHSIENIGIICLGIGTALLGRATGRPELVVVGLGAAVLHTWNHGLFKGLLFLAAGATILRTGTREIDRLGGVARRMPWTAALFLCGSVAIVGLPPLNGFVSEFTTYLGLFALLRGEPSLGLAGAFAIPALAVTSAMALLCFVKVFGVVYLGEPRSEEARRAREGEWPLLLPMAVLATACVAIGVLPLLCAPALQVVIDDWLPAGVEAPQLLVLVPLSTLAGLGAALAVAVLAAVWWLRRRSATAPACSTWDCGYPHPRPSIQYTAVSFAQLFVQQLRGLLLPRTRLLRGDPLFPQGGSFVTWVPDPVLDRLLLPLLSALAAACNWLRLLQRGKVQLNLLYVFVTLLILLLLS